MDCRSWASGRRGTLLQVPVRPRKKLKRALVKEGSQASGSVGKRALRWACKMLEVVN